MATPDSARTGNHTANAIRNHLFLDSEPEVRLIQHCSEVLSMVAAPLETIIICFSRFVWNLFSLLRFFIAYLTLPPISICFFFVFVIIFIVLKAIIILQLLIQILVIARIAIILTFLSYCPIFIYFFPTNRTIYFFSKTR